MKELCVPLAMVAVLASLLLPVPPVLLDFLIVGNLVIALLLLVSSLYISDTLKLSALPTLLLVSTLYRLSLNVASTRLILGAGQAGHVIEAFGAVVIGGNLVVGAVIFLVITLIQFMVIAKGSERVAEVAARFTLDALPGKQMSIDADVRAGLIDFETARRRRQEMQTESRFYGALDGAMKFVKGDAIAGIIIAAINIVGGLAIGVAINGLDIATAVSRYSLLTIGDGLVSQVPALLSALAAGIVVTRVARGDGATVSQELFAQLGQIKAAKFIIAGFCVAFMFVPGMPLVPFACLAIFLSISALIMKDKVDTEKSDEQKFNPRRVPLVEIVVSRDCSSWLLGNKDFYGQLNNARNYIYDQSGLLLLPPEFSISDQTQASLEIKVRGIVSFKQELDEQKISEQIIEAFKTTVLKRKTELVDDILTRRLLDFLDKDHPELVSAVVPGSVNVTQLTEILKELTREDISLIHLESILQGIAESDAKSEGTRALLEDVRVTLGRVIVDKFVDYSGKLPCVVVDAALDAALLHSERNAHPLPIQSISSLTEELGDETVVVVSKGARAILRDCLRLRRVRVNLIAHEEIPEDISLEIKAIVGGGDDEQAEELISSLAA